MRCYTINYGLSLSRIQASKERAARRRHAWRKVIHYGEVLVLFAGLYLLLQAFAAPIYGSH
jgi:hypothetical protein